MSIALYLNLGGERRFSEVTESVVLHEENPASPNVPMTDVGNFSLNPSYDEQGTGPDLFEYLGNWATVGSGATTGNWKLRVTPIGGSGDFTYLWTPDNTLTLRQEPVTADEATTYWAQAGTTDFTAQITCRVTDNRSGLFYEVVIPIAIFRGVPEP